MTRLSKSRLNPEAKTSTSKMKSTTNNTTMALARLIPNQNNIFRIFNHLIIILLFMILSSITSIICNENINTTNTNTTTTNMANHTNNTNHTMSSVNYPSHRSSYHSSPSPSTSSSSSTTNRTNESLLVSQHYNQILKYAKCQHPYARVVNIQNELHASAIKKYIPHCTILHHCGAHTGCCRSETEQCVPKTIVDVKLYFWTIEITPRGHKKGIEVITMKNHTECMCAPISSIPDEFKIKDDSDKQHFYRRLRPEDKQHNARYQHHQTAPTSALIDAAPGNGVPLVQIQTTNSAVASHSPPSSLPIHHYNT